MLKAENVTYKIDNQTLLDDVSVVFGEGSFSVIMGQNGAGKSTLMRILAGSLKSKSGNVLMFDKPLHNFKEVELARVRAVLSQHYEISFPVSVEDIVMMGRYPHFGNQPTGKDFAIIDKTLDLMGIKNLKHRYYDTLSGGEAQKVQMARVLAQIWQHENNSDKILFLDEPVSQLDIHYQHFILSVAKNLTKNNLLVIAILHDLNLALSYADNIIFMKNGKVTDYFDNIEEISKETVNHVFDVDMEKIQNPFINKPMFISKT